MSVKNKDGSLLHFLYKTKAGRLILKPLTSVTVSKICGAFLDSPLSKPLISPFVKKNNIDLSDYECNNFKCFNDCFCRKIKDGKRMIDHDVNTLISPCDGLLSAYYINEDTVLPIKQSSYTLKSLLKDNALADKYNGGVCLVFRLCVHHYHRYCYPAYGQKNGNIFIKGKLHTVRPIALESLPVFVENCREYTEIKSDKFGDIIQMEVGALLVGKIKNLHKDSIRVTKGEEKGMFLYGGSTVIMLLEKNTVKIKEHYFNSTENGEEVPVLMGEVLNIM